MAFELRPRVLDLLGDTIPLLRHLARLPDATGEPKDVVQEFDAAIDVSGSRGRLGEELLLLKCALGARWVSAASAVTGEVDSARGSLAGGAITAWLRVTTDEEIFDTAIGSSPDCS
jgi:hypothetical protein